MDDIEFLTILAQSFQGDNFAIHQRDLATQAARLDAAGLVHWREGRQPGSDIRGYACITSAGIAFLAENTSQPEARAQVARLKAVVDVLGDVAVQCERHHEQWGGAEHDDGHPPHSWEDLIHKHAFRLTDCQKEPMPDYRERLIKIAALAVDAVQVWDRQQPKEG